ncbi:putative mitochondrial hypothetical protein [Leptomonas pyrrhocoris]|uniref:Uncharacterized protein n=1 Tax=Leptomonas pyrrhocoris TaxID=157538 RepID=A0A0N0DR94_LEPPY|nr:putative mitochondrial hypothetical protein [Leptomonas pyrrhocoris]KPA74134.1 putative mitochondrial hypothetical protein [Leptomonas pyrrhocoris]|eukprot:XP_015652573.1 putative mitochondrial hypothetical protein [Leptomonas pyrrhocoris]
MLYRATRVLARDSLNGGSSMTLGSKGMRLSPEPHRQRMPWTAAQEYVPGVVLNNKDKLVLDGSKLVELDHIDRAAQVDPLEVLKATVATRAFNISTGSNVFQIASQTRYHGRGQKFYREEWRQGTYDKYITLAAIEFNREGSKGTAYGYITFHGESTTRPVEINFADTPGWHMEYEEAAAVPFDAVVPPPPSIGTEVPVDPSSYRVKAYPFYDAPNPPEFVERLLKDRGVLPDLPMDASAPGGDGEAGGGGPAGDDNDGSQHYSAKV